MPQIPNIKVFGNHKSMEVLTLIVLLFRLLLDKWIVCLLMQLNLNLIISIRGWGTSIKQCIVFTVYILEQACWAASRV